MLIIYFVLLHDLNSGFSKISLLQIKINRTESDQGGMTRDSVTLMSPEAGPVSILRNCLLALQLLPSNASAGMNI